MNERFLLELSEAELEAVEAADLWAANDEIFDDDDLPDHLDMREVAEQY